MTTDEPLVDPTLEGGSLGEASKSYRPADPLDAHDRYSIINLVGGQFREMVLALPPEIDELSETELKLHCKPTTTDYSLRASLWRAYDDAVRYERKSINQTEIFGGICSVAYWYRAIKVPEKVAWMIRPQQAYAREMEAILTRGTQRLWEIIDMDIKDKDDKIDVKRARLLLEAVQEVGNRVKGMAVQRINEERRSLKVSARINMGTAGSPKAIPKQSLGELRERLVELEQEAVNGKALPKGSQSGLVIDAVPARAVEVSSREGEREFIAVGMVRSRDPDG